MTSRLALAVALTFGAGIAFGLAGAEIGLYSIIGFLMAFAAGALASPL